MSSRRARASRITEDKINELVLKLQALLPHFYQRRAETVSTSEILKETCNYIKRLHCEVDELSERISQLLVSVDINGDNVEALRSLLQL